MKDQLKSKGKDPHQGAEKSLYKIQDQLLDVTGPLTCLWADLLQRALVLLGSTSHSINIERRTKWLGPK